MTRDAVATGSRVTSRRWDSRRVVSALVFVPLLYAIVRYLPPVALFGLVAIASLLAGRELYQLHFGPRLRLTVQGLGVTLTVMLLASLQWPEVFPLGFVAFLVIASVLSFHVLSTHDVHRTLADTAVLIFGVLYISLSLGHLLLTRALPDGVFLVFFIVLVTWAADTGAYYAGTLFGHTRLAPVISPNKTVEGLVGGAVFAVLASVGATYWFLPALGVGEAITVGLLLTVAGLVGDLSESMLKRSAGVKDSGSLIPGHGGMLDRLDSLLFTTPTFYYYVVLVKG